MPAGLDRIRQSMDVKTTPRDKGLELTLHLKVYDNGLIELDGIPLNEKAKGAATVTPEQAIRGWLGAGEAITSTLTEFHRRVLARADEQAGS